MNKDGLDKNNLDKNIEDTVYTDDVGIGEVGTGKCADSAATSNPSVGSVVTSGLGGSVSDNSSSDNRSSGDCASDNRLSGNRLSGNRSSGDCPSGPKVLHHALHHVLPAIARLGYEGFLVGGCVRDTILQQPIHDVDIVTNCPPSVLDKHFTIRADVSKNMAVTVLLLHSCGYSYEVAQFRGEGVYPAVDGNTDGHAHDGIGANTQGSSDTEPGMSTEAVATAHNDEGASANESAGEGNNTGSYMGTRECASESASEITGEDSGVDRSTETADVATSIPSTLLVNLPSALPSVLPRALPGDLPCGLCQGPSSSLASSLASALASNLCNDLGHRDFTLNALALDSRGAIIDPFGGLEDISRKLIRAVRNPQERIAEDPLRILRAVRFAVKYGFTIEKHTATTLQEQAPLLATVAPERIQQELEAMCHLGGAALSQAMQRLFDLGILAVILPEIANLNNFEHAPEHHPEGNAFEHTLACLQLCPSPAPHVLFAVLCHDIGKPKTFTMKNGRPAYHSHDRAALPLIATMARRLRWSNTIKDHALFAAQQHMRFYAIPLMAAHKTFALMESPYFSTLHTVARCDAQARGVAFDPLAWEAIERQIDFLRTTFMSENSPLQHLEGKRVMAVTGLKSGQRLGRIINKTKEWMLDNTIVDKESIDKRLVQLAKSMNE